MDDTYFSDDIAEPKGINNNNSPIGFNSPEWYTPDSNETIWGVTSANATPVSNNEPSLSQSAVTLFNKVLDSKYVNTFLNESAKARFGTTTKPNNAQGGVVPRFTNNPNPAPWSHLLETFAKPVQENPDVPGPFSTLNMALIGFLVIVALFIFSRR